DPKNLVGVDRQLHQVVELFQQERADEGIPIAKRLVAEHPTMKTGYLQLAFLLQHRGDLPGALRVLDRADAAGLSDEGLSRKRALLLSEMARPGDAVRALEPYRDSEDLQTLNALGIALTDSGRAADGLQVFQRALRLNPRNAQAYQNAGIALLRLDRLQPAEESLQRALAISRRSPRALNALG